MAQPLQVTCPSCSSKFHIPLHLVRGKVVSFRCKKCRGTIPVDGRALTSATPIALQVPNVTPPEMHEPRSPFYSEPPGRLSLSDGIVVQDGLPTTSGMQVDTPSAFAHSNARNAPPLLARTPPMGVGPAMLLSTPPTTLSKSNPPEPLRNTYPPTSFRPANSGKKVVAAAVVLAAASITVWSMSRQPRAAAPLAVAAPQEQPRALDQTHTAQEPVRPVAPAAEPVKAVNPANLPVAKDEPVAKTAPAAHHAAKGRPAKAAVDTAEPTAEEAAPAPQAPAAAAAPAPQAPAPAAAPASEGASNEIDFNKEAARLALEDAGQRASSCRTIDTPAGPARVTVTFAPGGNVTSAVIESGPLVGTSAGGCLTTKVRSAKVPAFTGESVTVKKSISF